MRSTSAVVPTTFAAALWVLAIVELENESRAGCTTTNRNEERFRRKNRGNKTLYHPSIDDVLDWLAQRHSALTRISHSITVFGLVAHWRRLAPFRKGCSVRGGIQSESARLSVAHVPRHWDRKFFARDSLHTCGLQIGIHCLQGQPGRVHMHVRTTKLITVYLS